MFNLFTQAGGAQTLDGSNNPVGGNTQPQTPGSNIPNNGQQKQQPQLQPGDVMNPANRQQSGNPNNPNGGAGSSQGIEGNSDSTVQNPMDKFKDIWQDAPVTDAQGNPVAPGKKQGMFSIDPNKIMEAAGKVDFTQVVTPEIRAAIEGGGPEGTKALMSALKNMQSQVFGQGIHSTARMIEAALAKQQQQFESMIPGMLKKHGLSEGLRNKNPALSNPAVAPVIEALVDRFSKKFPNNTSAENQDLAEEYFTNMASSLAPGSKGGDGGKTSSNPNETDWNNFLPQVG